MRISIYLPNQEPQDLSSIIILQVSCVSSSAALANRVQYPSYFQVLSPDVNLADGFLAIIQQFGWRKVGLIVQDENLLTVVSSNIHILHKATGKLMRVLFVNFSVSSADKHNLTYRIYSNSSNFSLAGVRLLIEGGSYSRTAFIYFGGIPLRRSGGILL